MMRRALFCTDSIASSKYFGRAAHTGQAYSSTDRTMLQYTCTSCLIVRPLFLSARSAYKRLLAFLTICSMCTFAWMISSEEDYSEERISDVSLDVHRLVLSLSQDVIHCFNRGRIKTPKHVALPLTVKSLTGSAETVTILNRFRHGLSYTQIELKRALAERELERQREGVLLPSVCSSGVPGVFCWDNNDLQEETLSGQYYTLQSFTFGTKQCYI